MAVKQTTKSNVTVISSTIGLVISFMVLLFGNNIIDRFNGPQLIMNTMKFQNESNDKMAEYIKIDNESNMHSNFPGYVRVISIKNIGSTSSNNLNININLDGEMCDYKIDSTETIDSSVTNNQKLTLKLPRLSRNSEIKLILWLKDEKGEFQINYADDKNSKIIERDDRTIYSLSNINIIIFAIGFLSLGILVKEMIIRSQISSENRFNEKIVNAFATIISDIKEEKNEDNIDKEEEIAADKKERSEKARKTLEEMINISKKI